MPALLEEIREDMRNNPTTREFVVLKHGWIYNSRGPYLAYYLDEHEDLEGKLQVLANLGFVREISYNKDHRFLIEEKMVTGPNPIGPLMPGQTAQVQVNVLVPHNALRGIVYMHEFTVVSQKIPSVGL
jgi:hypothetical protein